MPSLTVLIVALVARHLPEVTRLTGMPEAGLLTMAPNEVRPSMGCINALFANMTMPEEVRLVYASVSNNNHLK